MCCSVLQCVAVSCSVLQRVAACCGVLQCVAVCCTRRHEMNACDVNVLQALELVWALFAKEPCCTLCCSLLQCVAVCCSVLQCVAVCCSVLQCFAVKGMPCILSKLLRLFVQNSSVAVCHSVVQFVAVCCSVVQFVAVRCSEWRALQDL